MNGTVSSLHARNFARVQNQAGVEHESTTFFSLPNLPNVWQMKTKISKKLFLIPSRIIDMVWFDLLMEDSGNFSTFIFIQNFANTNFHSKEFRIEISTIKCA